MQNEVPQGSPRSRPQTVEQAAKEPPKPNYLKRAKELRTHMAIVPENVDDAEWKSLMQLVLDGPEDPTAFIQQDGVKEELKQEARLRYLDLQQEYRVDAGEILNALLTMSAQPDHPMLPEFQREAQQHLAIYLQKLREYQILIGANQVTAFPEYLASFVSPERREVAVMMSAKKMLRFQYDVRRNRVEQGYRKQTVDGNQARDMTEEEMLSLPLRPTAFEASRLVNQAVYRDLTMADMRASMNAVQAGNFTDEAFAGFLQKAGYIDPAEHTSGRKEAVIHLAGTLLKYEEKIADHTTQLSKTKAGSGLVQNPDTLLLADALDCCSAGSLAMEMSRVYYSQFNQFVEGTSMEAVDFVGGVMNNMNAAEDLSVQSTLRPLAQLESDAPLLQPGEFATASNKLPAFLYDPEGRYGEWMNMSDAQADIAFLDRHSQKLLKEMVNYLQSDNAKAELANVIEFAQDSWLQRKAYGPWKQESKDTMMQLVEAGELPLRDAFELYYLLRSNTGPLPLTYKVTALLEKNGRPDLANHLQQGSFNAYLDLFKLDNDELPEQLKANGFSPEMQTEIQNAKEYMEEEGLNFALKWLESAWIWSLHHPYIATATGIAGPAVVAPGLGYASWKAYAGFSIRHARYFASENADVQSIAERVQQEGETTTAAIDRVEQARKQVGDLVSRHDRQWIWKTRAERASAKGMYDLSLVSGDTWKANPDKARAQLKTVLDTMKKKGVKCLVAAQRVALYVDSEATLRSALTEAYSEQEANASVEYILDHSSQANPRTFRPDVAKQQTIKVTAADIDEASKGNLESAQTVAARLGISMTVGGRPRTQQELLAEMKGWFKRK